MSKKRSIFITICSLLAAALMLVGVFLFTERTHSDSSKTQYETTVMSDGVKVYVSGKDVLEKDGKYYIEYAHRTTTEVTLSAINETKKFKSMTLTTSTGTQTFTTPVATVELKQTDVADGFTIQVESTSPTVNDRGRYFANPYYISRSTQMTYLADILSATNYLTITAKHFAAFEYEAPEGWNDFTAAQRTSGVNELREKLRYGYFALTDNLLIGGGNFYGIGTAKAGGVPFQGCFDFNGYNITLNLALDGTVATKDTHGNVISRESALVERTMPDGTFQQLNAGVFNHMYVEDRYDSSLGCYVADHPCLLRDVDVQGTLAVNYHSDTSGNRVFAGGAAAVLGKKVVVDDITSSVSVEVNTENVLAYVGGLFGLCATDIDSWCESKYTGTYSTISAITSGKSTVCVGGLAGGLFNVSVEGFTVHANSVDFIAQSLGTGSAYVGSVAGYAQIGAMEGYPEIGRASVVVINNITVEGIDSYTVSALIHNGDGDAPPASNASSSPVGSSAAAYAGSMFGRIYRDSVSRIIEISNIRIARGVGASSDVTVDVSARTKDAESKGVVFAGGAFGYIENEDSIHYYAPADVEAPGGEWAIYEISVNVSAIQNGIGPAYAGGLFGYHAFRLRGDANNPNHHYFNITDYRDEKREGDTTQPCNNSLNVLAEQGTSSSSNVLYDVCAGFYTSVLQDNYAMHHLSFYVKNGTVTAKRSTGSEAVGDIAAGGIAGKANAPSFAGDAFNHLELNFKNSAINAYGYSFDSSYRGEGNNVYVGGCIGLIENYGVAQVGSNATPSGTVGIQDISVNVDNTNSDIYYVIRAVQNAVSGNTDYWTEGYTGGVFGMMTDCYATGLSFKGVGATQESIYFSSTNNPNTASVGGIVGATRTIKRDYALTDCSVENAQVVGRAYYDGSASNFDLFVGGTVGVLGSDRGNAYAIKNMTVKNTSVESIGELHMLTFSGGMFGGVWWTGSFYMDNCFVYDSYVLASSNSFRANAAGITGHLGASGTLSNAYVIDTTVRALSNADMDVDCAGIATQIRGNNVNNVQNCVSNATLIAERNGVKVNGSGIGTMENGSFRGSNNYFVGANAFRDYNASQTTPIYSVDSSISGGKAIFLYSYTYGGSNSLTRYNNGRNELTLTNGKSQSLYPALSATTGELDLAANGTFALRILPDYRVNNSDSTIKAVTRSGQTVTATNVDALLHAVLSIKINGEYFRLCRYAITVNDGKQLSSAPMVQDEVGADISEMADINEGYDVYKTVSTLPQVQYLRIHQGDMSKPDTVHFEVSADCIVNRPVLYQLNEDVLSDSLLTVTDGALCSGSPVRISDEYIARLNELFSDDSNYELRRSASIRQLAKIDIDYHSLAMGDDIIHTSVVTLEPQTTLRERMLLCFLFDEQYKIIVELIPNKATGITIQPSADTAPMLTEKDASGNTVFVYAPDETVRLDAFVTHEFDRTEHIADTIFEEGNNTGAVVHPNGTIELPDATDTLIAIQCTTVGYEAENTFSKTVYISVQEAVTVEAGELVGANYSAIRKQAIIGVPFAFDILPQPGYGLNPENVTLRLNINGTERGYQVQGLQEELRKDMSVILLPGLATASINGTEYAITADDLNNGYKDVDGERYYFLHIEVNGSNYWFNYEYNATTGKYTFTIRSTENGILAIDGLSSIYVDATFTRVYSLIFDFGEWSAGNSDPDYLDKRYFIYTVKRGRALDETLLTELNAVGFNDKLEAAKEYRKGFVYCGMYSVANAGSIAIYGDTFEQICHIDGEAETMTGSRTFFARWTYTAVVKSSVSGIKLESGFNSDFLVAGEEIIPINDLRGFNFRVNRTGFLGTPRVDVYVRNRTDDGFTLVNEFLTEGGQADSYLIPSNVITGTIYFVIYADNLTFTAGESSTLVQTDSLRSDGRATYAYNVNYGTSGKSVALNAQAVFDNFTLPTGTVARLFHSVNKAPYTVYEYTATAPINTLSFTQFIRLSDATAYAEQLSDVTSETFYLVVTLPIGYQAPQTECTVQFISSLPFDSLSGYGATAETEAELLAKASVLGTGEYASTAEVTYTVYPAANRTLSVSNKQVTYEYTDLHTNVPDERHDGKVVLLKIAPTDGSKFIAGSVGLQNLSAIATLADGVYYKIEAGTAYTLTGSSLNNYTISLIEVDDANYPALGRVLASVSAG